MRIVHLSDVHVQTDHFRMPFRRFGWRRAFAQVELVGLGRAKRYRDADKVLRRIVQEIEELQPDHVLLSGDLTSLAVEEEFLGARAALGALGNDPSRLTVIPGNHDRYTAHSVTERRFERHFRHLLSSDVPGFDAGDGYPFVRLVGEQLAVVGLDSTRLAPAPGLSFGRVDRRQLDALDALLDAPALKGRAVCVMVHHAPLHRHGGPDRITHGLWRAGKLLSLLEGRACTLHHGHVHQRYWHHASGARPDLFGAGSSTMSGDEGYWVIDLEDGRVRAAHPVRPKLDGALGEPHLHREPPASAPPA